MQLPMHMHECKRNTVLYLLSLLRRRRRQEVISCWLICRHGDEAIAVSCSCRQAAAWRCMQHDHFVAAALLMALDLELLLTPLDLDPSTSGGCGVLMIHRLLLLLLLLSWRP